MSIAKTALVIAALVTLTSACTGPLIEPADPSLANRGGGVASAGPSPEPNSPRAQERPVESRAHERPVHEPREPRFVHFDDGCRMCGRGYGR